MVQCLSLHLPMQRVQIQPLVAELRSHMTHDQKIQTDNRSNIIINSIETLKKYPNQKKILKIYFKKTLNRSTLFLKNTIVA